MRIGIAFDLAPEPGHRPADAPDDAFEEFDAPETVEAIAAVLRDAGHDVFKLGDGRGLLRSLLDDPPDLVWNLAEGEGVGRGREARVPSVCEMLGVPYTGSDALTLAAALDKPVAKRLVSGVVAVAGGWTFEPGDLDTEPAEGGPWIVKPCWEGSSKGIRRGSVVETTAEAVELARGLASAYGQPVLVEEYVVGDELTVGLVGNPPLVETVGVLRIRPKVRNDRFVYALESKRDWDDALVYECPAPLDHDTERRVLRSAGAAFHALGCRDVARIDFRLRGGVPVFIEANPLPGLAPDWSDLAILARGCGLSHRGLILKILEASLRRLGLGGLRPGGRS